MDNDKFTYKENELKFVDSQCELCMYYNDGKRSDNCPMELIDKIEKNDISCPNIKVSNILDDGEDFNNNN